MMRTVKVIINVCHGSFGLSETAYEWLIAHGIEARRWMQQQRDPKTRLFLPEPANEGRVIFDRLLTPPNERDQGFLAQVRYCGRYWEFWASESRSDPLLVQCVEELGEKAAGRSARLKIVEIPEGVEYEISECEGFEHVAEKHRTWS